MLANKSGRGKGHCTACRLQSPCIKDGAEPLYSRELTWCVWEMRTSSTRSSTHHYKQGMCTNRTETMPLAIACARVGSAVAVASLVERHNEAVNVGRQPRSPAETQTTTFCPSFCRSPVVTQVNRPNPSHCRHGSSDAPLKMVSPPIFTTCSSCQDADDERKGGGAEGSKLS